MPLQVATTQSEKNVQEVREYDLLLDVDFSGLKYSGKVVVDLESIGDVSLDAVGQQISSVKSSGNKVPFKHSGKVLEIQTGKFSGPLEIDFSGRVSDNFTGLYKASYGDGYILSTHLEAVQARKVLPCVDHPAFKAVFKVRVKTDADLSVISNMPIESETRQGTRRLSRSRRRRKCPPISSTWELESSSRRRAGMAGQSFTQPTRIVRLVRSIQSSHSTPLGKS